MQVPDLCACMIEPLNYHRQVGHDVVVVGNSLVALDCPHCVVCPSLITSAGRTECVENDISKALLKLDTSEGGQSTSERVACHEDADCSVLVAEV